MTDQVTTPPESVPHGERGTPPSASSGSILTEAKGSLWAAIIVIFYVSGFLVLNAHLFKFGLYDFEFVSGRYLLAAANFAFFLLCFYLFAGREVVYATRWLSEDLQQIKRVRQSLLWSVIVFVRSYISFVFFCCLSAALFSTIALGQIETAWFYAVLSVAFLIRYPLDVTNLDVRFPRINEIVRIVVEVSAIFAFFVGSKNLNLTGVFWLYVGIAVYINLVLDIFQRYRVTLDRIGFYTINSVVFVLITALSFGATYFGQVSSKIGGGRPQSVTLTLVQEVRSLLPDSVVPKGKGALNGQLLYQTDKYLYVNLADQVVRLRADDIAVLVLKPEPTEPFWKAFEAVIPKTPNTAGGRPPPADVKEKVSGSVLQNKGKSNQ